ncbi:MAG: hypothetical protein ACXABO_10585 [Promethearchaeota archaeon]
MALYPLSNSITLEIVSFISIFLNPNFILFQKLPLSLYFQSLNEAFKEKIGYEAGMSIEDTPIRSGKAISEMELEKR